MSILLVEMNCQVILAEPVKKKKKKKKSSLFDHSFLIFLLYTLIEQTCSSYLQLSVAFKVYLVVLFAVFSEQIL